jgi:hypothetical protein
MTLLIRTVRWGIIALVLVPWIALIFGERLPEAWIAAGVLELGLGVCVLSGFRGAADGYRRAGLPKRTYSTSLIAFGSVLIVLGVIGTLWL